MSNIGHELEFTSGDTEYVRLTVKDPEGDPLNLDDTYTCVMGIKRKPMDTTFILPEKVATIYEYEAYEQPYHIEFKFTDVETRSMLNYNGKERKSLTAYYDVELTNSASGDVVTILAGTIKIERSISGGVI